MTPNLSTLRSKLEAATGGDREIDARLHVALFPDEKGMVFPGSPSGLKGSSHDKLSAMDWAAWEALSAARGSDLGMVANHHLWPAYTSSLDASLALVGRVLPGADWSLDPVLAVITLPDLSEHRATGATPALALLAALLSALEAQGDQQVKP